MAARQAMPSADAIKGAALTTGVCRYRYSGAARAGGTGAAATVWVSDSSVVCKTSGSVGGSAAAAVTTGARAGSVSGGLSYDGVAVSGVTAGNAGVTGGGSVSVSGADLGTQRYGARRRRAAGDGAAADAS